MAIVEEIYKKNINITDLELATEIIKHQELSIIDLWLLPQYPFDQWRKKYDYPRILKNIKTNQNDFITWMSEQGLTDEHLLGGYLSDYFEHKELSVDKKKHLIEVSYKGKVSLQAWHSYDGKTSTKGDGEPVLYKFIKEFISYYDWKLLKGEKFNFKDTFHRDEPNTPNEEVYLNHNIGLLKMGGIRPPVNAIGVLLRGKKLEFINASGLELKGTIYYGDMGNLSFEHSTVDNLQCNELNIPYLDFQNCSIKNLQIRNSIIKGWLFVSSDTTGNIIDTKFSSSRIYGGLFNPTFTNSEIEHIEVQHKGVSFDNNFEKTYRTLSKCAKESGNKELSQKLKIDEFDFIREKKKRIQKCLMTLNKLYWGYGQNPMRLITISIITILGLGLIYSFCPHSFNGIDLASKPYWKRLYNTEYYSVVTFTTLGYGDLSPTGFMKLAASFEALFGAITLGFLVAGLSRND